MSTLQDAAKGLSEVFKKVMEETGFPKAPGVILASAREAGVGFLFPSQRPDELRVVQRPGPKGAECAWGAGLTVAGPQPHDMTAPFTVS